MTTTSQPRRGLRKNPLLAMIRERVVPLGMQCFTGNPALIEVLAATGFDFVMLDCEHSGNDPRAIEDLIRTCDAAGIVPLVRIPDRHDESDVRRAFEAGALGVFVPMVRSAADVRGAMQAAFFPPKGTRGICPSIRAACYNFEDFDHYVAWNNAQTLIIPLIEHPDAVENIDEICALEDVHIVTFGAGDLAYAMGEGTQMLRSPRVQQAYRTVLASAQRHDVAVLGGPVLTPTAEACRKALDDGIRIFCLGLDTLAFRTICESTARALDEGLAGSGFTRPHAAI